ncbi:MAG TPA: tRNA (guanosine(46)-N7)-methyltransferase TrmB [Burkholderiales bacterium]|nr:tRNA (guanosine(46)-N7)-methyltransferase TrmB [Burkholderiales bacterium]
MATPVGRPIRSFVLRQGRTTPAQQRALDRLFPIYGISFPGKIEGRKPLVLEIGSGMGETTLEIAKAHPEIEFVAVEVHGPGVGSLLNRIDKDKLTNLRVVRHDAVEVLERMVADGSLAALHLFFPDPWPKKRHHKRRLVQPGFASVVGAKLAAGGILHAATDVPDYAEHIERVFSESRDFEKAKDGLVERPTTKFEARGQKLGHPIRDLFFRRRG